MKTIIISDIHIGAHNCQAKLLVEFLENIETNRLILNGDVFESFNSRLHKWNWKILSVLRKISDTVELIWVRGNHDDMADSIAHLIGAKYCEEYIFDSEDKKILCIHGDKFDNFLTEHPILTIIADFFYWLLQKINLDWAKLAKHNSKTFLRCAEIVKKLALKYKDKKNCDFVCCGHTHFACADDKYYNSGSWTELPASYLQIEAGKVELKWISANLDN